MLGVETAPAMHRMGEATAALAPVRPAADAQPRPRAKPLTLLADLTAAVEHRRFFVLLPFSVIAGLVLYAGLPVEPTPWALLGALLVLLLACLLLSNTLNPLRIAVQALAVAIGFSLLPLHGALFGTPMLARPTFGTYQAQVVEIISASDTDRRIVVEGLVPSADSAPVAIRRVRLLLPPDPPLHLGDRIEAPMRLAPIPGPVLPDAYDGQFHNFFAGIGAYGTATGSVQVVATAAGWSLDRSIEAVRVTVAQRIDAVLDGPAAAIGRAMTMGDQSAIDDGTRDAMAASGLAHVYSISGLHLSIVAGGVFFLLRLGLAAVPATVRWPNKQLAAIAGLLAACAYLMLAGGPANVPALRSTLMLGLVFGAVLAGRRAFTMRNVALAALLIIAIDPASVFRASFQLSFAAVIGLVGIYQLPRRREPRSRALLPRLAHTIAMTALTSFIAGTATALFSAYHFQQTAPLGVLGNVLVLPVVGFVIMPFATLSLLFMPWGFEGPFVRVMGWGIERMVDGAVLVAQWSAGLEGNPLLAPVALLIGLAALAWFAFVPTWWRLLGPALAVPLIAIVGTEPRPDLLIADTTQAVALRTNDDWRLLSGQPDSFAVEVWSEHFQALIAPVAEDARCDGLGCIAATDSFSLALVRNAAAFAEDCGAHDLLVTRLYAPGVCRQLGPVIDAADLRQGGVHALYWDQGAGTFQIRTAVPDQSRPWRPGR